MPDEPTWLPPRAPDGDEPPRFEGPPELPDGWIPPSPPTIGRTRMHPPAPVPEPRQEPQAPSSPLAVSAIALSAVSILLLVFSVGTLFAQSALMAGAGLAAAAVARKRLQAGMPLRPAQIRAAMVIGAVALALAFVATITWSILSSTGYTPDDLQRDLERKTEQLRESR